MSGDPLPIVEVVPRKPKSLGFWMLVVGSAGLVLLLACAGMLARTVQLGKRAAEGASDQIDEYLAAIDKNKFGAVYDYSVSKAYRRSATRDQRDAIGRTIASKLGSLKSKKMHSVYRGFGNGRSEITAVCDGEFEKGVGTISAKLVWEDGSWKFEEFRIQSPALVSLSSCASCGASHPLDAKFCPTCGKEIPGAK